MWTHDNQLLADITLPTTDTTEDNNTHTLTIHPALLDAALHPLIHNALTNTDDSRPQQLWLPYAWTDTTLHATGATHARVRITPADTDADSPTEQRHHVTLTDAAGNLILTTTLATRPISAAQLQATQQQHTNGLFALEWAPASPAAGSVTAERTAEWAVLGGERLRAAGVVPLADLDALRAIVGSGSAVPPVVLTEVAGGDRDENGVDGGLETVQETLALVREWLTEPLFADARLVIVTRNAVAEATGGAGPDPVGAAVWGLIRSAQSENPGRFVLVDAADDDGLADAVGHAVDADEPQVAVRDGRVIVPRLVRASAANALVPPVGRPAWRLDTAGTATIDSVAAVPFPEALEPLTAGQVRIAVRAGGVNFRDVLISLGMVPGQTGLGGEGAGVVLDVAADVTRLSPGDEVMGVFEGAFGQVTVADARMVAPMPEGWSFAQAAAVPVAFLTAWYGLVELGGLRAGETVLIHTATGGVGTAAVQIARHLGATVYATAGPGKHHVLEAMGIDEAHRASSRDLDFEDTFRTATAGAGFDVVLNSLAGPFTDASLRLLTGSGRFLEMGKTDIREPKQVAEDFPGVDYRVYDLVTDAGAERIGRMLAAVGTLFAEKILLPPPVRSWPLAEAHQALRHMSQARHTGKLVLEIPPALDPAGTVLVTGGTGTLGGLVAEHLVRTCDVRHLLLLSRRGPEAPGADELAARLREFGASVRIAAVDTADPAALDKALADIDPAHPLTGVVHTAGIVDDAVLASQTPDRVARVWAAKAATAANLHRATANLPLGLFAMFSSAAATLGSPGQANYAAANAYCDALAARRRATGLSGVSIAWGLWAATSGMTGHLADTDRARMSRTGVNALGTEHALALFDAACRHSEPGLVAIDLDVNVLAGRPAHALPAALRTLATRSGGPVRRAVTVEQQPDDWTRRLAGLPAAEQRQMLLTLVRTHAASVLGHADPEAVRAEAPFTDLGFDSLTAVELRNRLSAATGLRLPAALVFDFPSAGALADHLLRELVDDGTAAARGGADPVLGELARLESTLSALDLPDTDAGAVTARLEGLLAKWKAAYAPPAAESAVDRLELATADQVLAFIDNELGSS